MTKFKKAAYSKLDARQKEIFNFQWISGALATYGYHTHRIPDDWLGADFIARRMGSDEQLLVQLKSRVHFAKKYWGRNIWIAFRDGDVAYCYPHDEILMAFQKINPIRIEKAWKRKGKPEVHWGNPTKLHRKLLEPYRIDLSLG